MEDIKELNLSWVGELSAAIIKQSIEDYQVLNKKLSRTVKKLKKQQKLAVDLKEQKLTKNKIKREKKEIRKIIRFFHSDWYIFLTDISANKMKEILKQVYINNWNMKKKSFGYLCLCENFRRKEI